LSSLLVRELQPARRAELEALPDLELRLEAMLDAGKSAFPHVALDASSYLRFVAAILDDGARPVPLESLQAADLYLACACAHGDPAAVATIDRDFITKLHAPLRATGLDAHAVDDVMQRVRELLLVGKNDLPGIASYRGRGQLRSWLRAVAVRQAMTHFRGRRETPVDDSALGDMVEIQGDAQLAPWKQEYAAAFREAFGHAISSLSEHDRTLLRQHHLDQLTIDELATLYKVSRATAARWVAGARATLFDAVRARMVARLAISPAELDSALRLARSQLDFSIHRLLGGKRQRKK